MYVTFRLRQVLKNKNGEPEYQNSCILYKPVNRINNSIVAASVNKQAKSLFCSSLNFIKIGSFNFD